MAALPNQAVRRRTARARASRPRPINGSCRPSPVAARLPPPGVEEPEPEPPLLPGADPPGAVTGVTGAVALPITWLKGAVESVTLMTPAGLPDKLATVVPVKAV